MNLSVLKNRNKKPSKPVKVEPKEEEVYEDEYIEDVEDYIEEPPVRKKKKPRKVAPKYYEEEEYEEEYEEEEDDYEEYQVRRPIKPSKPRRPSRPASARQLNPIEYYDEDDGGYYQEPVRRSNKPVSTLATIGGTLSQAELKQHIVEALGLTTCNSVEVYQQKYLNVEPLTFEIKDLNGSISLKLEAIEKETGLSVIPFKLAGLNNFITEIPGYTIIESDKDKFVSSTTHPANMTRLNKYIEEWKATLQSGLKVDAPLEMEYTTSEKTYKMCSLNQYEIDYLQTLFRNYGAVGYIVDGVPYMAIGY